MSGCMQMVILIGYFSSGTLSHASFPGFLCAPALQMIAPLLALSQNRSKLKVYIAHLTDLCHDRDPSILSQLTPPSHYHHSPPDDWEEELQKMSAEQVKTSAQPLGEPRQPF